MDTNKVPKVEMYVEGLRPSDEVNVSREKTTLRGSVCVYVANRIIITELREEEKEIFRHEQLTLDMKVKDYVKENFSYRYNLVEHENEAVELERYIQEYGINGELPYLNGRS